MQLLAVLDNPVVQSILDFVFPPLCLGCGEYYEIGEVEGATHEESGPVCGRCRAQIEGLAFQTVVCAGCGAVLSGSGRCPECGPEFWPLMAYANYRSPMKDVILQYKFSGITSPAGWIAPRLATAFEEEIRGVRPFVLMPIPLHPSREYYRGYNQAKVFAEAMGRATGLPVVSDLLVRTKRRRAQSRVEHRRREANVRGVFGVAEDGREVGDIVLVDDVVTTGATIREARKVLHRHGYRVVGAMAMAHGV